MPTLRRRVHADASAARALAFVLLMSAPAGATTIDPLLWQQLADGAAFIGVVECDQAGGIVARYRVVETWKGKEKAGDTITLQTPPDIWGPQYPLALVGDRAVVAGFADRAPSTMASTSSGPRFPPIWAREQAFDYALPLFQGRANVDGKHGFHGLGSTRKSLAEVRKDIRGFVALPEDARARALLVALTDKYVLDRSGERERDPKRLVLVANVRKARTHDEAVRAIVEGAKDHQRTMAIVVRGASESTKAKVRALAPALLDADRERPPPPAPVTPSPDELMRMRDVVMRGDVSDQEFWPAAHALLAVEPEPVVRWLSAWSPAPDEGNRSDVDGGYHLGSWVGHALAIAKQTANLELLVNAKDPYVRVAGAVYLALVDEAKGAKALRGLTSLDGDAGAWAALTLARRGDRDALTRAVQVLPKRGEDHSVRGPLHNMLQMRVVELLSNTAASIGKPTPTQEDDDDARTKADAFLAANPGARPVDPWFTDLASRHVD